MGTETAITNPSSVELSQHVDRCRSCESPDVPEFLDLGVMPLANALRGADQLGAPEHRFPLLVAFCRGCSLVQITETVRPDILFSHYLYASSNSDTMLRHAEEISRELTTSRQLGSDSLVVEIASNDGYLLQYFAQAGVPVLGVEPAQNIAAIALEKGIPTRCEFFTSEYADHLASEGIRADVVLGNNVLAHVADLNGFVLGVTNILKPDGIARFEFPYVGDLLDNLEFDTIYHEHLCYFSAHAIDRLFRRHGLVLSDVKHVPIHGGTLQATAAFEAEPAGAARVEELLEYERRKGLDTFQCYADFGERVEALAENLRSLLYRLKAEGKRAAAYGASAKGATLLNYLQLTPGTIEYVVDRSPLKQGLLTPGTHLPIHAPSYLAADRPDYLLLLTWNFAEEILAQQAAYREAGGRFIIPVPEPRIV